MIDALDKLLPMGFDLRDEASLRELDEGFQKYNPTDSPFTGTVAAGDGVIIPVTITSWEINVHR